MDRAGGSRTLPGVGSAVELARVRLYEPGDEEAILAAWRRAFPAAPARDLAEWRRRFLGNPAGTRIALALGADGEVLAHYALVPFPARLDGERCAIAHAVDTFALPEAGLARGGLLARCAERLVARYAAPAGPDVLHLGLAVRPAWRFGRARLGYRQLGPAVLLEAPPDRFAAPAGGGSVQAGAEASLPAAEVDALFERLAPERGLTAVRDAAELVRRYGDAKGGQRFVAARGTRGALVGWAVLAATRFLGRERLVLVDHLAEGRAWPALLDAFAKEACARELPFATLLSPHAPEWTLLQRAGMRVLPLEQVLAGRSYLPHADVRTLGRRLDWRPGDTDLV